MRARKITVGGSSVHVAQSTTGDWQITTGLNGEQPSWPYKLGNTGVDSSVNSSYHSTGVHTKTEINDYLGWPGNGGALHCDLHTAGGSPSCSPYSVVGLEHSDPDGTYG